MRAADGARLSALGDLLFLYASTVNWFLALRTYKVRFQTCCLWVDLCFSVLYHNLSMNV